jgi:DMSO/TMAO reductase YedYZ heme-binding membrane subunit
MTALDLAADVGLLAVFLAATNICVGLLIAVRYSPRRRWPHRRVNIFAVHTWTAYFLMTSLLVHPIILLFSTKVRWRPLDLVFPIWSPVQPIQNTIGAVSLYLIVVVVATSYFRVRLGRHRWKLFHYLVYVAGIGTFIHGILADPNLKGNAIDLLDGEKLFIESCLLVVVLATVWAWRYRLRKDREERTAGTGRYRVAGKCEGEQLT